MPHNSAFLEGHRKPGWAGSAINTRGCVTATWSLTLPEVWRCNRTLWGFWGHILSTSRFSLASASSIFPEIQRVADQGKRRRRDAGGAAKRQQRSLGQGPGSSSRDTHDSAFDLFCRIKAPSQVEKGYLRLSTRFLEHCPVPPPPTTQKEDTRPAASLHPKFCLFPKPSGN